MKRLLCRLGLHDWVACFGNDWDGKACWRCGTERAS